MRSYGPSWYLQSGVRGCRLPSKGPEIQDSRCLEGPLELGSPESIP